MKKIMVITFVLLLSTIHCFADEGETEATPSHAQAKGGTIREAALRSADTEFVTGKVVCVALSDLTRPRAVLTVADGSGNEISFEVKALAVIYDRAGTLLALDELQSGQDVQVNYRLLGSGAREATSIKVLQ